MSKARNPDALIRIEDAIKVLCRETCHPGMLCPDNYCAEMWDEFEDVERVDAVPVVRCKDCKFFYQMTAETGICELGCPYLGNDGFCSEGEQKDGDND